MFWFYDVKANKTLDVADITNFLLPAVHNLREARAVPDEVPASHITASGWAETHHSIRLGRNTSQH